MMTVEFPGQFVVTGEVEQPLLAFVTLVDDPHGAVCARGFAVVPGEPPPGVLHPQRGAGAAGGTNAVLQAIGHAASVVALVGPRHGVEPRLHGAGIEQLREPAASRNFFEIGELQDFACVCAPRQSVAAEIPRVKRFACGCENRGRIEVCLRIATSAHGRLTNMAAVGRGRESRGSGFRTTYSMELKRFAKSPAGVNQERGTAVAILTANGLGVPKNNRGVPF